VTLLTIVQDACVECNQPRPTAVISNSEITTIQMLSLANAVGDELQKDYAWQKLTREASFSAVATASQGTIVSKTPTAGTTFDRFVNDTMFNRTAGWRIRGPVSSQEWQSIQSTSVAGLDRAFYIRQGNIYMTPIPTAGDSIYFEYVATQWCESSGGTGQTAFAADTDVCRLDERLMKMALVYRFRQAKGLPHIEHLARFEKYLKNLLLSDGSKAVISMAGRRQRTGANIPEGSWNL
jgi:hypothetical protein